MQWCFTKLIFFLTADLKMFTLCDIIQQMKKVLPYTYIYHSDVATSWTSRVFWRQLTVNSKCWLVGQIRKMVFKISIILVSSSNFTNLHKHSVTSRHYVHKGKLNNIWCIDHFMIDFMVLLINWGLPKFKLSTQICLFCIICLIFCLISLFCLTFEN